MKRWFFTLGLALAAPVGLQNLTYINVAMAQEEAKGDEKQSDREQIRELIQSKKLAEAAEAIANWQPENGLEKLALRQQLVIGFMQARNAEGVSEQNEAILSEVRALVAKAPAAALNASSALGTLLRSKVGSEGPEKAAAWYRQEADAIIAALPATEEAALPSLRARGMIEGQLADMMSQFNLPEDTPRIDKLLEELKSALAKSEGDNKPVDLVMPWVTLSQSRIARMIKDDPAGAESKAEEVISALSGMGDPAKDMSVLNSIFRLRSFLIQRLASVDGTKAKGQIEKLNQFLDQVMPESEQSKTIISNFKRSIASMQRSIESEIRRAELVGQKAVPLDAEVFVNGEALTDEDLKGKVVLIDFWAVWCGPCIATFPHLREWNEKHEKDGLVILGVTKYYKYDWDTENNQIKRAPELSKEDEQKALVKFAEFHELKHRFVVTPDDSKFSEQYGVTGIPQAVLIDRDGVVQMIKVGSGEENAKALDEKIQELLKKPASN